MVVLLLRKNLLLSMCLNVSFEKKIRTFFVYESDCEVIRDFDFIENNVFENWPIIVIVYDYYYANIKNQSLLNLWDKKHLTLKFATHAGLRIY